jgi:hypothetical protein
MPLVYADTSALFAYLHPDDEFWTCDVAQAKLARSVGLKTRLFEL